MIRRRLRPRATGCFRYFGFLYGSFVRLTRAKGPPQKAQKKCVEYRSSDQKDEAIAKQVDRSSRCCRHIAILCCVAWKRSHVELYSTTQGHLTQVGQCDICPTRMILYVQAARMNWLSPLHGLKGLLCRLPRCRAASCAAAIFSVWRNHHAEWHEWPQTGLCKGS